MTEHWASYFCNVNGKLASVFLDINLKGVVPDSARPWLLWVWLYFRQPRPDGLSSAEEFPVLCDVEEKLNESVLKLCNAVHVGRITTGGRREFYYYAPKPVKFEQAVRVVMENFAPYEFERGSQNDPSWNQYSNVLFPSKDELQKILNREVLDVMERQGDRADMPREVLHWVYFSTEAARTGFKTAVEKKGYRINSESQNATEENPFGVCFGKVQTCESGAINGSVLELIKLAARFGGDYDGWEAQIVLDDEREEPTSKPN